MKRVHNPRLSGLLLIGAAMAFFAAAFLGRQPAFSAVGVVFLVLGATQLRRSAKAQG